MTGKAVPLSPMRRRALDKLLIQYLELPEREQSAWLNQTCKRLPRLGRWLEHLAQDSHTITLLDDSVRRLAGESVEQMEADARVLNPGDQLAPWKVIAEIGRGGMGRVYRGQRADGAFEMDVAIKLIGQRRRGLAELLQRESRLLARLDHPSVTRLVDAGLDEQAGPFLVMEWVEGTDLADWIEREQPDPKTRLKLFEGIAEAVAHAHQRLIVHGDIKPNNIRIRADGTVKLMDFGVARLLDSGGADHAGLRALTPEFAAPEQKAGEDITPASDVWSLGALLGWLLTDSPPGQQRPDSINRKLPNSIPRPTELAAVINRACASQPEQRYGSVRELIDDVNRYRHNEPLEAAPVGVSGRLWKFVSRNRMSVTSALVVAGLLVGASVLSTFLALQAEQERQKAEQSAETARTIMEVQQSLLADMQPNQLADGLVAGLRGAIREGPEQEYRLDLFNRIIEQADTTDLMRQLLVDQVIEPAETQMLTRLEDSPLDMAALQDSLGQVYMRWSMYDQAIRQFRRASDQYQSKLSNDTPEYHASTVRLFSALARSGQIEPAMELATEVVDATRQRLGADHAVTMEAEHAHATLLLLIGQHEAGIQSFESLAQRRLDVLGPEQPEPWMSMHNQATGLLMSGQFEPAKELLEQVIDARIRIHGPSHALTLATKGNLASALVELEDVDQGLEMMERIAALQAETLGRQSSSYLLALSNIALVLRRVDRIEEALELENALVDTHKELLGRQHLETLRLRLNRATTQRELGNVEAAYEEFTQVADSREQVLGPDNLATLNARVHEAHARWLTGQASAAAQDFKLLGERLDANAGPLHEQSLTAQIFLARILDELGRRDEAITRLEERLLAMKENSVPEQNPERVEILELLDQFNRLDNEEK
jgi:eukaryotic-like serine/threonine-protein kinase